MYDRYDHDKISFLPISNKTNFENHQVFRNKKVCDPAKLIFVQNHCAKVLLFCTCISKKNITAVVCRSGLGYEKRV